MQDTVQTILVSAERLDHLGRPLSTREHELVDDLNHTSAIHLQTNGPGLLSTPLIRGFGARHTAIVWEEFNIQSPLNGTFDIGLITGFDQATYTDRSLSAYLGTAALGGAIMLNDAPAYNTTVTSVSLSSMENLRASFSHGFQLSKLSSQISVSRLIYENKFNYQWAAEKQKWLSQVRGTDLKWNNEYKINSHLIWKSNVWLSSYDRKLPSSLVAVSEIADQQDDNYRYQTSMEYTSGKYGLKLSYAHFDESLNYKTQTVDSRAKNIVNALNLSFSSSKHSLNISHRLDRADANFFSEIIDRQLSTFSYKYNHEWNPSLKSSIVLSEQLHDSDWSPLLFDIKSTYQSSNIIGEISINRSYNTPTMNDLYWPQGGNPELLPEHAYGVDMSLKYLFDNGTNISVEPFYKKVNDWILWSPGDQFWSPKNQRSVLSRGTDIKVKHDIVNTLAMGSSFTYTLASIDEELIFKELEGKQLIYIPKVKSNLWLNYELFGTDIRPQALFVSQRYTTTDNSGAVPGYMLLDIAIYKQITLKNDQAVELGFNIENLLNKDYQQVEFYPMPLRYFELNLKYKIERQ